jgi:hypothetical protein
MKLGTHVNTLRGRRHANQPPDEGTGLRADQISASFETYARRCGVDDKFSPFDFSNFRPPRIEGEELRLF